MVTGARGPWCSDPWLNLIGICGGYQLQCEIIEIVSQLNGCRFCVDINSATLLKRGVPTDKVDALNAWQESGLFSERERVALEYAEAVTLRSDAIDEDLMNRLKKQFDEDAVIELTALIAFQNLSSKFNSALEVPPQGFCQIPQNEG